MPHPAHPVKGADGAFDGTAAGQVDIDGRGGDRLMPHEGLDGEQVRAVLVEVGAEGMAEMGSSPFAALCRVRENGVCRRETLYFSQSFLNHSPY